MSSNHQTKSWFWLYSAALAIALLSLAAEAYCQTPDAFNPGADGAVWAMAVQTDGKILVGGTFGTLGGQPRSYFARLSADGTLDSGFNPAANAKVECLAIQPDGKILAGGYFTTLAGQTRCHIARLNADGTLDNGFNAGASCWWEAGVYALLVQTDGKILVGGPFGDVLDGQTRSDLGRLNPDGTLDMGFNPSVGGAVYSPALQPDGKILVGGSFSSLAGQSRSNIGRLNPDGTLDATFNPGTDGQVYCFAVQADGKILVAGKFTTLGGQPRNCIGRLSAEGWVDLSFNPGNGAVFDAGVISLIVQADGRILVGGSFSSLGGQPRTNLARLNADGTLDTTFNAGADQQLTSLAMQPDGKILVGGNFTTLGGEPRNCIGRLNNTDAAAQELRFNQSSITWLRGGTASEVWRTSFDFFTNGSDWLSLGAGTRVPGGWQAANLSLPTNCTVRARGFVTSGAWNASGHFEEMAAGPAGIYSQPADQTNGATTTATFSVQAAGTPPLSYQWFKGNLSLREGGKFSGVSTPILTLSNVLGADRGGFRVVVRNAYGSVTSRVAALSVMDPWISSPPLDQTANPGESVNFSATAQGTSPVSYQWRKNGVILPGETATSLSLTNLQRADAAAYDVIASSPAGSTTSAVSLLTVNLATFDPLAATPNGIVYALAVQADGKILLGGSFNSVSGQPCNFVGRLSAGGALDSTFSPGPNKQVSSLAVQADARVLLGGNFTRLGGQPRNYIGRLNADGTLDTAFNPQANGNVICLAIQPDGKILVGGSFTVLGGQPRSYLGRLNADGSLDAAFNSGADGNVLSLAVQSDGKILVGGSFTTLGGQPRSRLGRINSDGALDASFNPGADGNVYALAEQGDGTILIGGKFATLGGQPRSCIGRFGADGMPDAAFSPGADNTVYSLVVQADGRILVGGVFTQLGGQTRNCIGRLSADGSADITFAPGANGSVYGLALQADGKILAGGPFMRLGGQSQSYFGRLNNTDPAVGNLTCDGSTITWLRGGTCPEVWRTTFDVASDGTNWVGLGAGSRVPGGWRLTGLSLARHAPVRAQGFTAGGRCNGSTWLLEDIVAADRLPTAASISAATCQNQPLSILIEKLLMLAFDPDGDPLRITAVSVTSTNGGGVVLGTNTVTYAPAAGFIGTDCFTYTVDDGWGGAASGRVVVQVRPADQVSGNMMPITFVPGGLLISFAAIPGCTYTLQRSLSVSGPWFSLGTITVGSNGLGTYADSNAPPLGAFYRTVYP